MNSVQQSKKPTMPYSKQLRKKNHEQGHSTIERACHVKRKNEVGYSTLGAQYEIGHDGRVKC